MSKKKSAFTTAPDDKASPVFNALAVAADAAERAETRAERRLRREAEKRMSGQQRSAIAAASAPKPKQWDRDVTVYTAVRDLVQRAPGLTPAQISGAFGISRGHRYEYLRVYSACCDLPNSLRQRVRRI